MWRKAKQRLSRPKIGSEDDGVRKSGRKGRSVRNPYAQLDGEEAVALFLKRVLVLVTSADEIRFAEQLLLRTGVPLAHARVVASALAAADVRSRYAFGLLSLPDLLERLMRGFADAEETPTLRSDAPTLAVVEAGRALGPVAGHFCMQLAMDKAARSGLGVVFCRGDNDVGLSSWYTDMAVKRNMIGLCFSTLHETTPDSRNTVSGTANVSVSRLGAAVPAGEVNDLEVYMSWRFALPPQKVAARQTAELRMAKPTQLAELPQEPRPPPGACGHSPQRGFLLALLVEALCGCIAGLKYRGLVKRKDGRERSRDLSEHDEGPKASQQLQQSSKSPKMHLTESPEDSQQDGVAKNLKWATMSSQQISPDLERSGKKPQDDTSSIASTKSLDSKIGSLVNEYMVFSVATAPAPPRSESLNTRRQTIAKRENDEEEEKEKEKEEEKEETNAASHASSIAPTGASPQQPPDHRASQEGSAVHDSPIPPQSLHEDQPHSDSGEARGASADMAKATQVEWDSSGTAHLLPLSLLQQEHSTARRATGEVRSTILSIMRGAIAGAVQDTAEEAEEVEEEDEDSWEKDPERPTAETLGLLQLLGAAAGRERQSLKKESSVGRTREQEEKRLRGITDARPTRAAHCFVALDAEALVPGYAARVGAFLEAIAEQEPMNPTRPVLIPGDPERLSIVRVLREGGVRFDLKDIETLNDLAKRLDVRPLKYRRYAHFRMARTPPASAPKPHETNPPSRDASR